MRTMTVGIWCSVLLWASQAQAVRTVTTDGLISVKLELHQVSAMVLPEEVSTITTAMPASRLEISKDGPNVGFVLLDPAMPPNRLIITGISGRIYLTRVEVVERRGDDLVYVTHRAPAKGQALTPASLLRMLRSGTGLALAKPAESLLPAPNDPRLMLHTPRSLSLGGFMATTVLIENTHDTPLVLDIRVGHPGDADVQAVRLDTWTWPPKQTLKALAVDQDVLQPHSTTTLYLITEER